ncbi:MAG: hypothetical protein JNK91_00855 [Ferruginibacter sp.]|jgi:hypothetical protein|nr:hypothetical protein [Ferruginibacter sp.]MBN8700914.1 hypothetical protein [Chitinophagales bacterium]
MIKQNKTKLTLIVFGILFAGVIMTACNNGAESEKAEKKDSAAAPAPAAPAVTPPDSTKAPATGDTGALKGNPKPTPEKP